jgi:hypothetical protein
LKIREVIMSIKISNIHVGEPLRCKALSVFPLFSETNSSVKYILSDEAFESKRIVVKEISESGSVPELLVENNSDTRVLFIEGEELIGAKQNRILNTSVMVAAHSELKIPVSCVEQDRWRYKRHWFGSSKSHSPHELRYTLKKSVHLSLNLGHGHYSDQGKVWEKVGKMHAMHGTSSPTGAMSDVFKKRKHRIEEFRKKIKYAKRAIGLAVAIGKSVVALDIFDKPTTCKKVWDRLLSGFMMDALLEDESINEEAGIDDVEKLLKRASDAKWESVEPVGEGEEYRTEFDHENGSVLVLEGKIVHGSVLTAV